mmetsp:Transcript_63578/g.165244  ORF Transcript_63578/g.165244 Transcript_63578/m.165244 type:complete len:251 (-) Transcript_63578:1764-2516(-)
MCRRIHARARHDQVATSGVAKPSEHIHGRQDHFAARVLGGLRARVRACDVVIEQERISVECVHGRAGLPPTDHGRGRTSVCILGVGGILARSRVANFSQRPRAELAVGQGLEVHAHDDLVVVLLQSQRPAAQQLGELVLCDLEAPRRLVSFSLGLLDRILVCVVCGILQGLELPLQLVDLRLQPLQLGLVLPARLVADPRLLCPAPDARGKVRARGLAAVDAAAGAARVLHLRAVGLRHRRGVGGGGDLE